MFRSNEDLMSAWSAIFICQVMTMRLKNRSPNQVNYTATSPTACLSVYLGICWDMREGGGEAVGALRWE